MDSVDSQVIRTLTIDLAPVYNYYIYTYIYLEERMSPLFVARAPHTYRGGVRPQQFYRLVAWAESSITIGYCTGSFCLLTTALLL